MTDPSANIRSWTRHSLYALAQWKNGVAFKNVNFSKTGRPIIKIAELKNGITSSTGLTLDSFPEDVDVSDGDLLFSWSGNPDTSIDAFIWRGKPGWLNQHIFKVTPNPGVLSDYLFLLLKWMKPRFAEIARNKQTTGLGHVTVKDLKYLNVSIPPLEEQATIAHALMSLENKIEINKRINGTLEAMAQAIFKDWFADFGPVKRKLQGITDPVEIMGGITSDAQRAQELAVLFPEYFDEEGKPNKWSETEIGNISDIVGGGTPSTKELKYWKGGNHIWATPKDLSGHKGVFLSNTARKLTDLGLKKVSSRLSPIGTVLLSSRAPIGYVAIAASPTAVNQGFIALRPTAQMSSFFTFCWIKENLELIKSIGNGTTFMEVNKTNFKRLNVVYDRDVMNAFELIAQDLFQLIKANTEEISKLESLRNLLLPKLISGEFSVEQIREFSEVV